MSECNLTDEQLRGVEKTPPTLQEKHENFLLELKVLCEQYNVNLLFAINYVEEKQTAIDYVGDENAVIQLGLQKSIETMRIK